MCGREDREGGFFVQKLPFKNVKRTKSNQVTKSKHCDKIRLKGGFSMGSKIKLVEPTKAHMSKVERLEREEMQKELFEYAELNVTPPKHLIGEALKEWERIVPYIKKDVPVSELDYSLLASYCTAVGTIVECQNDINGRGLVLPDGKANPAYRMQSQAIKDMRMLANALAISLDGRMKLALNKVKEKPVDPFESLIGNG